MAGENVGLDLASQTGQEGIADAISDISNMGLADQGGQADIVDAIDRLTAAVGPSDSEDVTYDNTSSGLTATNVQDAVDELNSKKTNNYLDTTYSAVGMDEGNNQYIDIHARNANHSYTLYAAATGIYLWDGNARQSIQRMYWDPIAATLPTNTDLNDVASPGSYRLISTNDYTNAPYSGAYGVFEVVNNYTGVKLQRLTSEIGVWHRYYSANGTWTAWKKYFTALQSYDGTLIKVLDITATGDVPANSNKTVTSDAMSVPSGYGVLSVFPRYTSSTLVGIIGCYLTENSTKIGMSLRNFTSSAATGVTAHVGVLLCKKYS